MLLRQLNFSCILGNARSQYYKGKVLHYVDKIILYIYIYIYIYIYNIICVCVCVCIYIIYRIIYYIICYIMYILYIAGKRHMV